MVAMASDDPAWKRNPCHPEAEGQGTFQATGKVPRCARDAGFVVDIARSRPTLVLLRRLCRILHVRDRGELDVVEFATHLIDLADVDVLHDVARVGIDRDRPARALPR